ncbi:MAG: hypothetical protein ACTHQM_10510 [Thermoanaerobaculia bacterium]
MTMRIYDRGGDELPEHVRESYERDLEALKEWDPVRLQKWIAESMRRDALMESGEDPGLSLEEFWNDDEDDEDFE